MKYLKIIVIVMFCSLIYIFVSASFITEGNNEVLEAYNNQNLLRLHVVPHTNSPIDQHIKRNVRQQIKQIMTEKNLGSDKESISLLEDEINIYLNEKNAGYQSNVRLEEGYFPRRRYGNTVLPAGEYTSLTIELGRAQGTNWWCVLFPPLCYEKREIEDKQAETVWQQETTTLENSVENSVKKNNKRKEEQTVNSVKMLVEMTPRDSEQVNEKEGNIKFEFWVKEWWENTVQEGIMTTLPELWGTD